MRIIELIMGLGIVLIETSESFFDFLLETYTIFGSTYSVYELMFGGGFVFVLSWIMVAWVSDLLA